MTQESLRRDAPQRQRCVIDGTVIRIDAWRASGAPKPASYEPTQSGQFLGLAGGLRGRHLLNLQRVEVTASACHVQKAIRGTRGREARNRPPQRRGLQPVATPGFRQRRSARGQRDFSTRRVRLAGRACEEHQVVANGQTQTALHFGLAKQAAIGLKVAAAAGGFHFHTNCYI